MNQFSGRILRFVLTLSFCLALSTAVRAHFTLDREPPGPSSRKTGLVITEIMYNPVQVPGLATNLTHEFIEIYNSKPWEENIGGFSIGGDVQYTFPPNTVLPSGAYLVVARVPDMIRTNYMVTNVFGPWIGANTNRLSTEQGQVQLLNRQGAVLLDVNYQDSPPWPEAADGAGHSLSLVRPSYGENDFRAWAASDSVRGSPGARDPVTQDPFANIFINEWQNHSDPVDWIELYNHSNGDIDISGTYLSDAAASNFFRIPDGTIIGERGFRSWDQNQLGFELFAGGETIFFWSTNRARVIDVIDFRGQSNNFSSGRSPDGGPIQYGLTNPTRNNPNTSPLRYGVIINEIMFNPISGSDDDEYIEIHNRRNSPINIAGWEFVTGIGYVFPTNSLTTAMPAGAFWVLAKNPASLMGVYTNLNTNNTFGPYNGLLANGGERVVFAAADYDLVGGVTEKLAVPVSDVTYGDGGKWGQWSDGLGSSLELIDADADGHHPSNWADSNDTGESRWTAIDMTVPLGESLGNDINDSLILMLQGVGECLIDEIEVRVDNGPNLVANGGFEQGMSGWTLQGAFDMSTIENDGFAGTRSLHVRAAARGDNQSNRILSAPFASPIPPTAGLVSLRAKVRWLRGFPEFLLRLHGSATEAYGRMSLPRHLGTPGMPNSRVAVNIGPAVYEVQHAPLLPAAGEEVLVTARATDPEGIAAVTLRYRVDPDANYIDLPMVDNGSNGDAISFDGIYSARIPAQAGGTMIAFYVQARDGVNLLGTFPHMVFPTGGLPRVWPSDALVRECVVRWGEVQMPGDFATYHLWVSAVNSNRWHTREPMNNSELDGTFVYNNSRVIYNALPLFSGSPWHRTNSTTGPAGINRVDYEMNFPDDDALLGATDFVLNNPGNPDILTVSDQSAMVEQTVYRIFEGMGLPHNHRRYIHFFVNGHQRSIAHEREGNFIFEDSQQPNGDMIEQWFPNDAGGQLFKVEDWFEFNRNGFDPESYNDADLERRTILLGGVPTFVPAPYRFMFRKRSVGVGNSANDYSSIYGLIDATSPPEDPNSNTLDAEALGAFVDWEAWMRHFAVQRTVGNWDSFGWERGKNDYLYETAAGFVHMPWDIDYSLGLGRGPTEPLFASNNPRVLAMFNTPAIVRAYWRAFQDIVHGPFNNETIDPFLDQHVEALLNNQIDINLTAVDAIKNYVSDRRAFLLQQISTVTAPFAVDGPPSFSTNNNLLVVRGTAPVEVKEITINGAVYPVVWTTVSNYMLRFVLESGVNNVVVGGLDRLGAPVPGAEQTLDVTYTGPVVDPSSAIVVTEIMFSPGMPAAQFIEFQNRSQANFSLANWRLQGVNYTFPVGSILTNGEIIVLAQSRAAFATAYGNARVAGVFTGNFSMDGEIVALIKPSGSGDIVVDAIRYEAVLPWPEVAVGESLQLIDYAQDNARSCNWAYDATTPATPGATNSVAATLDPFVPLWLNEVQTENLAGPFDNQGEREPWLELYNGGTSPINLSGFYLARSYLSDLLEWPLPAASIPAGATMVLWMDGETLESTGTHIHAPFRLDYEGKLALVRIIGGQPQIADYLTFSTPGANVAYGDYPDGQPVYRYRLFRTSPDGTNVNTVPQIFINEWMARRGSTGITDPADGDRDDWFELYNGGTQSVDLGGYYLTDNLNSPTKYTIPNNGRYVIPPGGFRLVWADEEVNQNSAAQADLHVNFKLAGSFADIGIFAPDGMTLINGVTYGEQTNDVSEGRFSDGAEAIYVSRAPSPRRVNLIVGGNLPPAYPAFFPRQFLAPGERVTITTFLPTDPDAPPQLFEYAFAPPREGAAINPAGAFRWIVPSNQPPGDYVFTLYATDNGVPPRTGSGTLNFTVTGDGVVVPDVPQPPMIQGFAASAGQMTFSFATVPGRAYRVLYTENLGATPPVWMQAGKDFVAANSEASLTDNQASPQRYYVLLLLD